MKLEPRRFRSVTEMVDAVVTDKAAATRIKTAIDDRRLCRLLLVLRCRADLSQEELAERMGCSQSQISRMENGKDAAVSVADLLAYAKALKLDVHLDFAPHRTAVQRMAFYVHCLKEEIERIGNLVRGDVEAEKDSVRFFGDQARGLADILSQTVSRYSSMQPQLAEDQSSGELEVSSAMAEPVSTPCAT